MRTSYVDQVNIIPLIRILFMDFSFLQDHVWVDSNEVLINKVKKTKSSVQLACSYTVVRILRPLNSPRPARTAPHPILRVRVLENPLRVDSPARIQRPGPPGAYPTLPGANLSAALYNIARAGIATFSPAPPPSPTRTLRLLSRLAQAGDTARLKP